MSRLTKFAALLASLAVAACASAPQSTDGAGSAIAPSAATEAQAQVQTQSESESAAAEGAAGEVTPNLVVDARDPNPSGTVVCRELLREGSNVIIKRCMTLKDWETFERIQAQQAEDFVRRLQGLQRGPYR
jgi:hypothetical protein